MDLSDKITPMGFLRVDDVIPSIEELKRKIREYDNDINGSNENQLMNMIDEVFGEKLSSPNINKENQDGLD